MFKTQINSQRVVDFYVKKADGLHRSTAAYYFHNNQLYKLAIVGNQQTLITKPLKYYGWSDIVTNIVFTNTIDKTSEYIIISDQDRDGYKVYAQLDGTTLYVNTIAPDGTIVYFNPDNQIFHGMTAVQEIDSKFVNKFDFINDGNIQRLFYNCSSLRHIPLFKNTQFGSNASFERTFYNCSSIENWDILDNWDVTDVARMDKCFYGSNISYIPSWENTESLFDYGGIFLNCYNLEPNGLNPGYYDFSTWKIRRNISFYFTERNGLTIRSLIGMSEKNVKYNHWNVDTDNEYLTYTPSSIFHKNKNIICVVPQQVPTTQKIYADNDRTKYTKAKFFVDGSYWYTDGQTESPYLNAFTPGTEIHRNLEHQIRNLKISIYRE